MLKRAKFLVIAGLLLAITTANVNAGGRRSRIGGPRHGTYSSVEGVTNQNAQWADTFGREYTTGYGFGGGNGLGGVIDRVGGIFGIGSRNNNNIETDCCGHPEDPPIWNPPASIPTPEPWNPPTKRGGLSTRSKVLIGVGAAAAVTTVVLITRHHGEDKGEKKTRKTSTTDPETRRPSRTRGVQQNDLMCIANRDALNIAVYYGGSKIALVKPETALWPIPNGIQPGQLVTKVARKSQNGWLWINEAVEAVLCTDPPGTDSDQ